MTRSRRRTSLLAAAVLAATAGLSAPAALANGGASADDAAAPQTGATQPFSAPSTGSGTTGSGSAGDGATSGGAVAGSTVATASANGVTIKVRAAALLKRRAKVSGTAPASLGSVRIEALAAGGTWTGVATATVSSRGAFSAAWRPSALGDQQLRVVAAAEAAPAAEAPPQVAVKVYRPGVASWYGPGFYGGRTACGVRITKTTVGVAHKTLPCGTQVELQYGGRTLVAPVIDRGPFIAGRSWDLTKHTHGLLGATAGLITVGALPQLDAPRISTPYDAKPTPSR